MLKKIIISVLFCICASSIYAQSWNWALRQGNIKSDKATAIRTDDSGYVYVCGYFSTSINIGTNNYLLNFTANAQSKEAFVAKLDSTGFCYWARSGGQYFDDRVLGMDVDSAGNSVITGTFWEGSGINMNGVNVTGSAFGGGDQCFIYKHDRLGNTLWGRFVCSDGGDDQGLDVATDKFGNNYVVGFMGGTNLFCGGNGITAINQNASPYRYGYWLTKLTPNGTFLWAKTFGRLPVDTPSTTKYVERDIAVAVDDSGGVYITGGYNGTTNFGGIPKTSIDLSQDIFVTKYDTNGVFQWVTTGGSRNDDWSNGICVDNKGSIYITGEHRDSLIIDTVLIKNYNKRDVFIAKLDSKTGSVLWGKRAGSDLGSERGNDVWADSNCNVYVCGDIQSGAKFGDNITTPLGKSLESFVAKISPEGKWIWAATGGGADSNDRANSIVKGHNAQLYTCGYFRSPATFGSTLLASVGSSDAYLARLKDSVYNINSDFKLTKPTDTVMCKVDTIFLNVPKNSSLMVTPMSGVLVNSTNTLLTFIPKVTTSYTITGIGAGLCPSFDTISFTIVIAPDADALFTLTPNEALLTSPIFTTVNTSTNAVNYTWNVDNVYESNLKDITKNVGAKEGIYCFTLIAESAEGCLDSVSHCGEVIDIDRIFFPNSFSPNNDNVNDEYGVVFNNKFRKYEIKIYNRLGNKVWETSNPSAKWNGKIGFSEDADIGVYFYICNYTTKKGENKSIKGDITLVR
jgi:gliding motility-associated-like protein